jgi:bifunctional DNase/RNase
MLLEMKVSGIALDPFTNTPIVILKDFTGEKILPIWIGFMEASSIAMELEKTPRVRPLTHDLVKNLLEALKFSVTRVEVTDLRNDTFYAEIYLKRGDEEHVVDSRPSDAIAIALRTGSPIFVKDEVIEKSKKLETGGEEKEKLTDLLDKIPPGDFGKYKM